MKEVIVDTLTVVTKAGGVQETTTAVMQEVNHSLVSMGVDVNWANKVDNWIVLLLIISVALLANVICRHIILRAVAKLV